MDGGGYVQPALRVRGRLPAAAALMRDSLAAARAAGDRWSEGYALH